MSTVQLDDPITGAPAQQQGIHGSARVSDAAVSVQAVTPSDTAPLPVGCKSLWVGGAGNVVVTMWDGTTATFTAVPAGTRLPVSPKLVNAATTATAITALF
jgi:hypothetical protein